MYASDPATPTERTPIRATEFDVLSGARSFESIAAWTRNPMVVGRGVTDDTVSVTCVPAQYFNVLRARAFAGSSRSGTPTNGWGLYSSRNAINGSTAAALRAGM